MTVLDRMKLNGRVALVTGGTKGLGRAMAEGLAEAGASVAIISRHAVQAAEVAREIAAATGQQAKGYGCDVTRSGSNYIITPKDGVQKKNKSYFREALS